MKPSLDRRPSKPPPEGGIWLAGLAGVVVILVLLFALVM